MAYKDQYEQSPFKRYIKLIPPEKSPDFSTFLHHSYFVSVADIVLDTDVDDKGEKKRKTLIKLANFEKTVIDKKCEWIYIMTINDQIVKIGGTRNGIKDRFGSYLCGHHITERNKSGKASETNKYVYNTLHFYLERGCTIKLFGFEIPQEEITRNVFGKPKKIIVQTYHAYESDLIEQFVQAYGFMPFLCDNSDPTYRCS